MTLEGASAWAIYTAVVAAAALESEVVFVLAAALVSEGHLHPLGVALAGSTGAALGDQACFFLLRGRLRHWLDRYEVVARHGRSLAVHVRRHQVAMILAIRFAPGLRVALTAACAYAGVPAGKFVVLNGLTCVLWAGGLLAVVTGAGSLSLPGLSGSTTALAAAVAVVIASRLGARALRRRGSASSAETSTPGPMVSSHDRARRS